MGSTQTEKPRRQYSGTEFGNKPCQKCGERLRKDAKTPFHSQCKPADAVGSVPVKGKKSNGHAQVETTALAPVPANGGQPDVATGEFVELTKDVPEDQAKVRARAVELVHSVERITYWELGKYLFAIQTRKFYEGWGFASMDEYVEKELGWKPRKSRYIIGIYKALRGKAGIDVDKLQGLEWTKVREIAPMMTDENAQDWIDAAREKTHAELKAEVRESKKRAGPDKGKPGKGKGSKTAGEEGTERWAVQLYPVQRDSVETALAVAGAETKSDKRNHNLDIIAQFYAAHHTTGGSKKLLEDMLKRLEDAFDIKVFVLSKKLPKKVIQEVESAIEELYKQHETKAG